MRPILPSVRGNLYIIISQTAKTSPPIPTRGYASLAGRIDVIARAITEVKKGSGLVAILEGPSNPPVTLTYENEDEKCNIISERQAIVEIAKALEGSSNCISAYKAGFDEIFYIILKSFKRIVLLHEEGEISNKYPRQTAYFLGSHMDIPGNYMARIERVANKTSLGPISYHTEHVIAYLEWARLACNARG